jgi:hypothetical protein
VYLINQIFSQKIKHCIFEQCKFIKKSLITMKKQCILLFAVLFLMPGLSFSQVLQNTKESAQNRSQIHTNKTNLQRDTRELEAFRTKKARLLEAIEIGDQKTVSLMKQDVLTMMEQEVQQAKAKMRQSNREVSQSKQEVRSDRREIRRDRADISTSRNDKRDDARDLRRDRVNKRDDKRDVRDDRRDRNQVVARSDRQSEILQTLTAKGLTGTPEDIALINEFESLMEKDINATSIELKEDRGEMREDSRERRDDRRERREGN